MPRTWIINVQSVIEKTAGCEGVPRFVYRRSIGYRFVQEEEAVEKGKVKAVRRYNI
jgi:hypothetical protein